MTAMFKVQHDVPLPAIDRRSKAPRRIWPVETMLPNDFFFVPGRETKYVTAYVSRITAGLPGKYAVRHCWATRQHDDTWKLCDERVAGATEGAGVWRTE